MKLIDRLEKVFSDEDHLIWEKQRAIDKNYSSLTTEYIKGYRDCWNKLRDEIAEILGKS